MRGWDDGLVTLPDQARPAFNREKEVARMNEVEFLSVGELLLDIIDLEVAVRRQPICSQICAYHAPCTEVLLWNMTDQSGWIGATSTPRTSADGNWSANSIAQIPPIVLEFFHILD